MKNTISARKRPATKSPAPRTYQTGKEAGEAKARHMETLLAGADWSTFKPSVK